VYNLTLAAFSWQESFHNLMKLPTTPAGWAWLILGFCGNLVFFTRFLIQWIYSEVHKESRVPTIFWWQSLLGSALLLVYAFHERELPFILGYIFNVVPYTRNLVLVYRKTGRRLPA
jgi:lipid-A-disaccharide synthase-like uncharacterized protein